MRALLARGITGLLMLLLLAVTVALSTVLLQTWREHRQLQSREKSLQAELAALRKEQARQEEYLRLIMEDPAFLERVVRDKLGYVRPDEMIFLFEEERLR